MSDLWSEGYNIGYKEGDRDGYFRGWHEAIHFVNEQNKVSALKVNAPVIEQPTILESDS